MKGRDLVLRAAAPVALAGWGALAWRWRPRDPFEWDEFLYLRGLAHYDVARHTPHPPGAPVYIFLGRCLKFLLGDGLLALQLLAVLSGATCLALVWLLARREAKADRVAWASALTLAAMPGFLVYANAGWSDVPALACLVGAWVVGLVALEQPRWLWAVAVLAAVGPGIRLAVLPALAPLAIAALWLAWRRREWRELMRATASGLATSLLVWLPAIFVTGPARYLEALQRQTAWLAAHDAAIAGGGEGVRELAKHWLQYPFGPKSVAGLIWLLAAAGAVAWWRTGRRWLVLVVGGGGVSYCAFAFALLQVRWAGRYGLPLFAVLALAAAGNLLWRTRVARWLGALALTGVAGFMVYDTAPVVRLRRRPAPVSAAFKFVKKNYLLAQTHVVFGADIAPHGEWLLPRLGMSGELWQKNRYYLQPRADKKNVVLVTTAPVPGFSTVFEREWQSQRWQELSYGRYQRALVQVPSPEEAPFELAGFEMEEQSWRVYQGARGVLLAKDKPRTCKLCPLSAPITVRQQGKEPQSVQPGECADLLVFPGLEGRLEFGVAEDGVVMRPLVFVPVAGWWGAHIPATGQCWRRFPQDSSWLVPAVARLDGWRGSRWVSELWVRNGANTARKVVIARLPSKQPGNVLPALEVVVAPGQSVVLPDVLAEPALGGGGVGALLVGVDALAPSSKVGLEVGARTYNLRAQGGTADGSLTPVPLERGLLPGETSELGECVVTEGERIAVGAVALGSAAVKLRFAAQKIGGTEVVYRELAVPVLGHAQQPWGLGVGRWFITLEIAAGNPDVRVVPYLSHVRRDGQSSYRVTTSPTSRPFPQTIFVAVGRPKL